MAAVETLHSSVHRLLTRDGGLNPPSEVMQSWPAPNYINPEERGWGAPALLMVMLVLTFMVFFARMWARLGVGRNAGLDDILMSIAMLPLLGLTISVILGNQIYGFQWHVWDQTPKTLVTARKATMAIEVNYMLCTSLIKISILCFYRRITGSLTNTFVYCVRAAIVFCVLHFIVITLFMVFTCTPVAGFFRLYDVAWRAQHDMHCLNEGALVVAVTTTTTLQDFIVCLLPIFLIWNLQIPRRQKLALCGIFGIGTITCICGVMRTYYAIKIYYLTYDVSWVAYNSWIWTALEADLAVICASAPALKMFFIRYFSASSAGYSGTGSRQRPGLGSQPYPKATQSRSTCSGGTSHIVVGGSGSSDVPMSGIKVSQGLDIHVEDNWDQQSDASSRNLTASPLGASQVNGSREWIEGCRTVCAAWKPSSKDQSRDRSQDRDIENGHLSR